MIGNLTTFEGYEVDRFIDKGGTANVYLIHNTLTRKQWALKEIKKTESDIREPRLIADLQVLRGISHPNIVDIVDYFEKEDAYYLMMEYVDGITLHEYIRLNPPTEEIAVEWGKTLCNIMKYLHSQNPKIIYRDLKPKNVMIKDVTKDNPCGTLKLIDFGGAKQYTRPGDTVDLRTSYTNGYCAPEAVFGHSKETSDIYTIGTTLYQLLTGRDPSLRDGTKLYPIRQINPELSEGLERIIIHATEFRPEDRYQTVEEMLEDLENYRSLSAKSIARRRTLGLSMIGCFVASIICFVLTLIFSINYKKATDDSYSRFLKNAQIAATVAEQVEGYEEAITLKPDVFTAYDELLSKVYLADGIFQREEAEEIKRILSEYAEGSTKKTNEEYLKDTAEYDLFCYKLGLAYYYYYEGTGNKVMCIPWLSTAAESIYLDDAQVSRAQRLSKIASYYQDLNMQDKAGDALASFMEYWDDMSSLATGNIVEEDNIKTALVVYADITYQIRSHAMDFKRAGVERDSLVEMLTSIQSHLTTDVTAEMREGNEEAIHSIEENIEAAQTSIVAAYDGRE